MTNSKRYLTIRRLWQLSITEPERLEKILEGMPEEPQTEKEFDAAVDWMAERLEKEEGKNG